MRETNSKPEIIHLEEVVSTNLSLRERLNGRSLPEGSVLWADRQTAGRGQMGNSWESEAGANLTFSTVLYPDVLPANRQFLIAQITALSVKETLDTYTDQITIKWPNDIYWRDRKICGMLIENDLAGPVIYCSIQGVGLNLNQKRFHSDAPNPVSLTQITGQSYDREEILHQFLTRFYAYYLFLLQEKEEEIRSRYHAALYRRDGFHLYEDIDGSFEATLETIEPTGHLVLRLRDNSLRRYAFKEVGFVQK
ncbi:biotin--[acetyl-CoA-carboxylase] ligase [Parabacteroides sp. PF5-6]|uniref:biotin--[acetyl-CoA-carboxylase] ligase n=1 Tax=Parabacteroides sp. PF5-6 TaxID=1742403 RepID=UPI002406BE8D|nr:biotin--[acetyl-CoA-carboxylase] ligase [Parabacteroides sp. PF5-6]MDF9829973.1 BirA family biotin operon repressor/biotin-[acetyl-CoA-carboxylase] ligase [Parabacteroides sp. PF5-6]